MMMMMTMMIMMMMMMMMMMIIMITMMVMMMMMMMIVIIIIAVKDAISSLRSEPFPTRTLKWYGRSRVQITCSTSSTYHVQHVVLRVTWYERTA